MLIITGFEASSGRGLSMAFSFFIGPASQPLGVNTGTTPGGTGTVMENPESWTTPMSGQAGFITLSARTATRVAGTFNYTAEALGGAVPATRVVTGGAFDYHQAIRPAAAADGRRQHRDRHDRRRALVCGHDRRPERRRHQSSRSRRATHPTRSRLSPKQLVSAGNTYGIPSQMDITVIRTGTADSWWGGLGADIGSVTITTLTTNRVVATFNGNLVPLNAVGNLAVGGGAINAYLQ
jgi:hypothetical protein